MKIASNFEGQNQMSKFNIGSACFMKLSLAKLNLDICCDPWSGGFVESLE